MAMSEANITMSDQRVLSQAGTALNRNTAHPRVHPLAYTEQLWRQTKNL